jgi:hypothetical protein
MSIKRQADALVKQVLGEDYEHWDLKCDACGHVGSTKEFCPGYDPSLGGDDNPTDVTCPKCGADANEHGDTFTSWEDFQYFGT